MKKAELTRFRVHYLWRNSPDEDWAEGKREVLQPSPEDAGRLIKNGLEAAGAQIIIGKVKVLREDRIFKRGRK